MKLSIQILVDNPNSWFIPYAKKLVFLLSDIHHHCTFIGNESEIKEGDILVLLSCEKKVKKEKLLLHKHNFVVHESDLPQGKGWSPLTWQILEGKNEIAICLFEAEEKIDAGKIYGKKIMKFNGGELIDELRDVQGNTTIELVLDVVKQYPYLKGIEQVGEESFYPRRKPQDSQLDIHKSIAEQFNLFRVVDNDRYPAFFIKNGIKYIVKLTKEDN